MNLFLCCFILHYSIVLLLYYSTALYEALRTYINLCHTNTILVDESRKYITGERLQ